MNDGRGHLSCKSHSARNEKDIYRICPSKLSKRELEDLYFSLLEQNVQLKKTINDQREQLKVLNTRLQRMTVQKSGPGVHNKDFSVGGKGIINEQKECIEDLKKDNQRLSERIRILNMRLCSAKQFLRRSPSQATPKCTKCLITDASVKNLSMSALNSKRSDTNLKTDVSPSRLDKDTIPIQLEEITSSQAEIPVQDKPCQRNECRGEIDELKQKIASLEEEMTSLRSSWSSRARELQGLASAAREEHAACPQRLADLTTELAGTQAHAEELGSQLRLERSRATELETRLRASRLSCDTALAAEALKTQKLSDVSKVNPPVTVLSDWEDSPPIVVPNNSGISIGAEENKANCENPKLEYGEPKSKNYKDEKAAALQKQGDFILGQIASLQSQLDGLKLNIAERPVESLAAESSLSHDIFSTSRLKTFNDIRKAPGTSPETDVTNGDLMGSNGRASQDNNKYGQRAGDNETTPGVYDYKYQIPGPISLDMPRISLGDVTEIKVDETKNRNSESSRGSKGSVRINLMNVKATKDRAIEEADGNGDRADTTAQTPYGNDEGMGRNRRSSLRTALDRKQSKELGVRYGQTQTYTSSEDVRDRTMISQGTNTDDYCAGTDNDSDQSDRSKANDRVSIRKIRYLNDENADPNEDDETGVPGPHRSDRGREKNGPSENNETQCERGCRSLPRDTGTMTSDGLREMAQETTADDVNDIQRNNGQKSPVELCAAHAVACSCPPSGPPPRFVRTCAGGQTAFTEHTLRYCRCGEKGYTRTGAGRLSSVGTPAGVLPATSPRSPAPTPDRTEADVSSITDAPRTEESNPSEYISPGEEKATSTLSESYHTTDVGSLSEGELPAATGIRQSATEDKMFEAMGSRSDKMEEALQAISEELTRCRQLLQGRTSSRTPKPSREVSVMTEDAVPIALRRAEAKFRIRDSYTPKCIFTLHIGTVVLSDQAVLLFSDKALLLSWRFYNQTPSMTRLLAGRVMNFDFSTEYDLKITEHFLYYLKHEEMPIMISEMDKQDEAFAACTLPLRDALLHPNRRVDMSLALVAGKQMYCTPGTAVSDNEEAGILDVWCMLRVDPSALPAINTAIVRPSSLKSQEHSSSMMEQMLEDEQSVDYRYSRDIHRRSKGPSEDAQSSRSEAIDKGSEPYNEVIENEVPTNIRSVNDLNQAVAKKSNDSTSIYEMLKNKKWNRRSTLNSQKTQDGIRQKSVTICNQPKKSTSIDRRNISQATANISMDENLQSLDITVQWLALNEDCKAMTDPMVKRLYVAYSFLGRSGADLETPVSLPKPKNYMDKCHFLFKKTFIVNECDMVTLGQLAQCREPATTPDPQCAVVFSVVSEPAEDPLGLDSCEDVGYAYLYLGDALSRSGSSETYNGVLVVRDPAGGQCGALAVRVDGLELLRRCRDLAGGASD